MLVEARGRIFFSLFGHAFSALAQKVVELQSHIYSCLCADTRILYFMFAARMLLNFLCDSYTILLIQYSSCRGIHMGCPEERARKLLIALAKFSKLGSALAQQVPVGAATSISTVEGGKGTVPWQHR